MEFGFKTLILVDNSTYVSYGNRDIMKATLKYLIDNAPESDDFALATYSAQTELLVDFGHEKQDYLEAIDRISYVEKEVRLTDVLTETIREWSDSDYALRNILLIGACDGLDTGTYPLEETYFTLYESSYPLFLIGLVQEENREALKKTASLARISHGEVFYSEFENSDAEVERKLSEQFYNALNKKRSVYAVSTEQKVPEDDADAEEMTDESSEESYEMEEQFGQGELLAEGESLIRSEPGTIYSVPMMMTIGLLIIFIVLFVVLIRVPLRQKKQTALLSCDYCRQHTDPAEDSGQKS